MRHCCKRLVILTLLITAAEAAHAWPTLYRITQIGGPGVTAYAINNVGQVTGSMATANGTHAFLYQAGKLTDIGSVAGYDATGLAINDAGQIVGDLTPQQGQGSLGFLYSNGMMTVLPTLDAGTAHCCYGTARAINSSGQVAGSSRTADGSSVVAVIYTNGSPRELAVAPSSYASGLNDYGQATGSEQTQAQIPTQFVYGDGKVTRPFMLNNGECSGQWGDGAINNAGQVPGYCLLSGTSIVVISAQGALQPLLPDYAHSDSTTATSINNAGQMTLYANPAGVCCAAWLYSASPVQWAALDSLKDPADPLSSAVNLSELTNPPFGRAPMAINDEGWIVGTFNNAGTPSALLLTPVTPYPSAVDVTASPSAVAIGAPFTVAWTDQSVSACTASGGNSGDGWGGSVPTHGGQQQLTEETAGVRTFTLTCAGAAGAVKSSVSVNVLAPVDAGIPASSGGGSEDPWSLLGAISVLLSRHLRSRWRRPRGNSLPPDEQRFGSALPPAL